MSWLRAFAFNIAFFGVTAVLGVAALPLLLAPRRIAMRFGRFWAQCVLALAKAIVGLDGEIRGIENLPPGGCLIAMKHQSAWDALILPVVLGDPAVVIKRELLWLPFYGWYAARAGSITIDRRGGAGALRRMVAGQRRHHRAAPVAGAHDRAAHRVPHIHEGDLPRQQVMRELETRIETATAALEREAVGRGASMQVSAVRT